jgi:hypothetical protein
MTQPPPGSPQEPTYLLQQTFPPPPPAGPKKAARWPKVLLGTVLLAVIAVAVYVVLNRGRDTTVAVEQGQCVKVVSAENAEAVPADCGSPDAVYRVAKKVSGPCPQGEYTELTSGDGVKLCLTLNATEGDCFKMTSAGRNKMHTRVPCAAAEYRVLKVVAGQADKALCAAGNVVATYAEPASTLCLTAKP